MQGIGDVLKKKATTNIAWYCLIGVCTIHVKMYIKLQKAYFEPCF
jgi:hypothetical protein